MEPGATAPEKLNLNDAACRGVWDEVGTGDFDCATVVVDSLI
jgi:hypothetical protein